LAWLGCVVAVHAHLSAHTWLAGLVVTLVVKVCISVQCSACSEHHCLECTWLSNLICDMSA
jgi:hypothetical protein